MAREKLERQFERLTISTRDFAEAREYLDEYDPAADSIIQRALISAAVIAYARPFSVNKRGTDQRSAETVKLKLRQIFSAEQLAFHEKVIAVRNEAIAHSDFERKATRRIPPTARTSGMRSLGFLTSSKLFDVLSEITDVAAFKDMTIRLWHECLSRQSQLNQLLQAGDDVKTFPEGASVITAENGDLQLSVPLPEFLPPKK